MRLLIAVLLTIVSSAFAQDEIRIGAVLPLSGDAQSFGKEARLALEHAVADLPKSKFSYHLLIEDDQLSSTKASIAARKLIEVDGVKVIFSNWSYGGNAIASVVKNKPVVNLAFAWDPGILKVGNNNFLSAASPDNLAEKAIERIKSERIKKIAMIGFQEAGVMQAFNGIERAAKKAGIEILSRIEIDAGDISSIAGLLIKMKNQKPDYLVTCLIYPQYVELFKQLIKLQLDIPVSSIGQAPFDPSMKKLLPKIWWSVDYKSNPTDDEQIRKRTGLTDLSGYPAYYEAMRMVIATFESYEGKGIPAPEWLESKFSGYSAEKSFLGKINYLNRRLQSENALVIDQVRRY